MKVNKEIGKSIIATVLGPATAVSCAAKCSAGFFLDIGLQDVDNTKLGQSLTKFIENLKPDKVDGILKSVEKVSSNIGGITSGLRFAFYGVAAIVGINLFKDVYNVIYNFSDFVSTSKKTPKLSLYSFSLPEIERTAKKVLGNVKNVERLVTIFRSQLGKCGFLNKSKYTKFRSNMVLAFSGNIAAGTRLWSGIRDIFFDSGLDVYFTKVDSNKVTPRAFLEKVNEAAKQNDEGLHILVYDNNLSVTEKQDKVLKRGCSSYLIELDRYSENDVRNMLEDTINSQFMAEFVSKNILVELTDNSLKAFSKTIVDFASSDPNLIFDTASSIVTAINSYIRKNNLRGGIFETLKIKVDTKNGKIDGLIISHANELVPERFLPSYLSKIFSKPKSK